MVHLLAVLSLLVSCTCISAQSEVVKRLTAQQFKTAGLTQPSRAEDFRPYRDGVGPLTISSKIDVKKKVARVHATATNDSGVPIRYARICIRPRDRKECAFFLWNTAVWQPGGIIAWNETLHVRMNWQQREMEVAQLVRDSKIYYVKKVYVDLLEGNGAGMSRDQLMALITNSSRFELVESPEKAAAERVTQTIVAETLVLRLTLASGESIWAWDDTKPCTGPEPKCAIDDLAPTAVPPFVPAR